MNIPEIHSFERHEYIINVGFERVAFKDGSHHKKVWMENLVAKLQDMFDEFQDEEDIGPGPATVEIILDDVLQVKTHSKIIAEASEAIIFKTLYDDFKKGLLKGIP